MLMEATQVRELFTNSFMKQNWNGKVNCFSQLYHLFWIKISIMYTNYSWIDPFNDWLFTIKHNIFQNSSPCWYCFPPFWLNIPIVCSRKKVLPLLNADCDVVFEVYPTIQPSYWDNYVSLENMATYFIRNHFITTWMEWLGGIASHFLLMRYMSSNLWFWAMECKGRGEQK